MAPNNPVRQERQLVIEVVTFGYLAVLFILAAFAPARVEHSRLIAVQVLVAALCYGAGRWFVSKLKHGFASVVLHVVALLAVYSFLFKTSALLQQTLVAQPVDATFIAIDTRIFGSEASLWMQKFISPGVTEWMMFAYVIYIPMLPILAFLCWRSAREGGIYDYLTNFVLVNILCYTGFILFPVETPMWHHPEKFVIPLEGGLFTQCGEWVRANIHEKGGGFPSPHCAMGTVMVVMIYRYWRHAFVISVPIVVTLYLSTVYCRYHYLWDAVSGVVVGFLVVVWSPTLTAVVNKLLRPVSSPRFVSTPELKPTITSEEDLK